MHGRRPPVQREFGVPQCRSEKPSIRGILGNMPDFFAIIDTLDMRDRRLFQSKSSIPDLARPLQISV
jgi:hypothetical protein